MKIEKKDLEKSQLEITVEMSVEEFKPYLEKGAQKFLNKLRLKVLDRESTARSY